VGLYSSGEVFSLLGAFAMRCSKNNIRFINGIIIGFTKNKRELK